jgi:DNA topoisomerase-3
MELDFVGDARSWSKVAPDALFAAPVAKRVREGNEGIQRNLQQQARAADTLILWLDCDREGENIAFEVVAACAAANPRLTILRARFSSLSGPEIGRALASLGPPDAAAAAAVDARQEVDLRVGAAFTRLQTLLLQHRFDWAAGGLDGDRPLLSYGPCQFPALGLIVQRAWEARAHVAEPFWYVHLAARVPSGGGAGAGAAAAASSSPDVTVPFKWRRGHLFDAAIAATLYTRAAASASPPHPPPTAVVIAVDARRTHREPPPPSAPWPCSVPPHGATCWAWTAPK